jgi:fluoride exporter
MGMESPETAARLMTPTTRSPAVRDSAVVGSSDDPPRGGFFVVVTTERFMNYLIVFLGAGIGGAIRHGINLVVPKLVDTDFPLHTLIINVLGSLTMGLIAEYFALKGDLPQAWRLFLTTGILGGFTTFSAFSLDAALLYERGEVMSAALYVTGSVVLAIAGLFAGLAIVRTALG